MTPDSGYAAIGKLHQDYYNSDLWLIRLAPEAPHPNLAVFPDSLNFGFVSESDTAELALQLCNSGTDTLIVTDIVSTHPAFGDNFGPGPAALAPGCSLTVRVWFCPPEVAYYAETLTLENNDHDLDLPLTGIGYPPGGIPGLLGAPLPLALRLEGAHPNPFNPRTHLAFILPGRLPVRLAVYNLAGREVAELVNGTLEAGPHLAVFDGTDLPSGVYLARLQAGGFTACAKLVLLK
ncbi:MAG: T9SS C-terminal target domain-containing protein [Candidatus Zixiibacteriota bacterium]|nr:MAG: T9SS C-terminal target domain-containing protein [candidate division Zixibacteria bacterium]